MNIKLKEKDGVAVCYVSGEVNLSTAAELKKVFKKIVEKKTRKVLLELGGVGYIDSSGLATLIDLAKNLKAFQGIVFMANLSPKVSSIFSITKLDRVFKIFDTEEEGLKNFYGY
jgi:anti-sigma B factor antagonist